MKKMIIGLAALAASGAALAHHSYAMFDRTKEIILAGTVTKWEWANPHVWIEITTDKKANWRVEMRSTGELSRQGLRSIDVKPGDRISLTVFPATSGKRIAGLTRGVLANGKKFGEYRAEALR
jgi:Family of unknown function (DUF6152)